MKYRRCKSLTLKFLHFKTDKPNLGTNLPKFPPARWTKTFHFFFSGWLAIILRSSVRACQSTKPRPQAHDLIITRKWVKCNICRRTSSLHLGLDSVLTPSPEIQSLLFVKLSTEPQPDPHQKWQLHTAQRNWSTLSHYFLFAVSHWLRNDYHQTFVRLERWN